MFSFLPGSKLTVDVGGSGVTINPETVSIDQTFQETNFEVKTLQDRNMVKESLVQKRATASFSFVYFMDGATIDSLIWEWFGLSKTGMKFDINPVVTANPIQKDFYLVTLGKSLKVSNAVIEDLEIEVRHNTIAKVTVTGSAKLVEILDNVPAQFTPTDTPQNYIGNNYITVQVGNDELQSVVANALSIRRSIEWLDQPTIHSVEAGEIYVPTIPIQTDLSVSGRYTILLRDNTLTAKDDSITLTSGTLQVHLGLCNISERLGVEQVLTKTLDYKLRPQASGSYIQYI